MRVLFIGNSHTFAHAMPFQVREMIRHRLGPDAADVWSVAVNGKSLGWHADETGTQQAIRLHEWDRIVLQQQTHPFPGYAQLAADFHRLQPHLAASGARIVLYLTWKAKDAPDSDQAELDDAFKRLADEQSLQVAPVGPAFNLARQRLADVELYEADGAHASPVGSYLAACTLLATLTGQSPAGLPACLHSRGETLIDLPEPIARALQLVAGEMAASWPLFDN